MYLNSHTWFRILTIKSLIFRQIFFPWNVSVNFRLNKCHSHTKILDYFGSYLLALLKKVLMKDLKFLLFPAPVTCIKSKNYKLILRSHKSRYFEIHHEVLIAKVLIKVQNLSFIHFISLKSFETTQKCLLFSNLLGSSYQ